MKEFSRQLAESLVTEDTEENRKYWADYIISNNIPILSLAEIIHADKKTAMRFSWMVGDICEKAPAIVYPAIIKFFSERARIKIPNYDRSLAKMFWLSGVPEEIEGEAIDELFKWLSDPVINVSTKVYSMEALNKLGIKYPDLKHELKLVLEEEFDRNTIAFKKRADKLLRSLNIA
jgi:hypothetical protein